MFILKVAVYHLSSTVLLMYKKEKKRMVEMQVQGILLRITKILQPLQLCMSDLGSQRDVGRYCNIEKRKGCVGYL